MERRLYNTQQNALSGNFDKNLIIQKTGSIESFFKSNISIEGQTKLLMKKYAYNTGHLLGKGAYGEVYQGYIKSEDEHNGEPFAIKAMSMDIIRETGMKSEIKNEIKILQEIFKLKNPFFIKIMDCLETKTNFYIVTELCDRGCLRELMDERVKNGTPFTEEQALEIVLQIALGLHGLSVNTQNKIIIHRDIKPENIFCSEKFLKIGDFGCAKITMDDRFSTLYIGTRRYCAPEFYNPNDAKSSKIDVWSLACIFHEI